MEKKFLDKAKLYCFYDFKVSPASYDFFAFLYSAEICRIRRGLQEIELVLVQGPNDKFRGDSIRTTEVNEIFFYNVIIPGLSILPAITSYLWVSRDSLNIDEINSVQLFPRGYKLDKPIAEYQSHELVAAKVRGDSHGYFQAPSFANSLVKDFISKHIGTGPFVTLTAREESRSNCTARQINKDIWGDILNKIKIQGITPIIVRDTSNAFDVPLFDDIVEINTASVHLPFRLALYEHAICNFTKNNGPSVLQLFGKSNVLYIAEFDNSKVFLDEKWWKVHYGMTQNSQFPMTTDGAEILWGPENSENILEIVKNKNKLKSVSNNLHGFVDKENIIASIQTALYHLIKCVHSEVLLEDAILVNKIKFIDEKYKLGIDIINLLSQEDGRAMPAGTLNRLRLHRQL